MARCSVFVDPGLSLADTLPAAVVGVRFDGEGLSIDEAIAQIPEDLRHLAEEAAREARLQPEGSHCEGDGLVDRPSTGWWASATL